MTLIGETMEKLVGLIGSLSQFLPVIFFSLLAFWKPNAVLYMLTGAVALFTGLFWYSEFGTPISMAIAMCLISYCLVCCGFAYKYLFLGKTE